MSAATQAHEWEYLGDYYVKREHGMLCEVEGMPGWWMFAIEIPQKRWKIVSENEYTTAFSAKRACNRALKTIMEGIGNGV